MTPCLSRDNGCGDHAHLQAGFDRMLERGAQHGGLSERLQQLVFGRDEPAAAAGSQHDDGR